MKSIEERVNFYTAPALRAKKEVKVDWFNLNEYKTKDIHKAIIGRGFFVLVYEEKGKIKFFNEQVLNYEGNQGKQRLAPDQKGIPVRERYVDSLLNFMRRHGIRFSKIPILCGDVRSADLVPVAFAKTRASGKDSTYSLLRVMNQNRHWGKLAKITRPSAIDISKFSGKKNYVIWRGGTTGKPVGTGSRLELVQRWFGVSKYINVGFSRIIRLAKRAESDKLKALEGEALDICRRYVKGSKSTESLKKYKYIISVEGNDKDSGLNWKLQSNSVVFMPKPKITSWLMEELLVPNVHYIQLKDDFSDLEEKFEWCQGNQGECKQIIRNAQEHMFQFGDINREIEIQKQVIQNTLNLIK